MSLMNTKPKVFHWSKSGTKGNEKKRVSNIRSTERQGDTNEPVVTMVLSDLHLCAGPPREDFHADAALVDLIEHLEQEAQGDPARLVLNGDIVDFLKVEPAKPLPSSAAIAKLREIATTHRDVFVRLAAFIGRGNHLVVLPGNHDVELSVPDVQAALQQLLCNGDKSTERRLLFPRIDPQGGRQSRRGSPYACITHDVHLEHGNQFDFANAFEESQLKDPEARDHFDLPVGSMFVFEVFNDLVTQYPWIDKIRPKTTAALLLWLVDPELFTSKVEPLLGLSSPLLKSMRLHTKRLMAGAMGKSSMASSPMLDFFNFLSKDDLDVIAPVTQKGGIIQAVQGPQKIVHDRASIAKLLRRHLLESTMQSPTLTKVDAYGRKGLEMAREKGVKLVCFGHTHLARDITQDGIRYMNTGTWIALGALEKHRLERLSDDGYWTLLTELTDPALFKPAFNLTYADIRYPNGTLEANLRVWDSSTKAPRAADA